MKDYKIIAMEMLELDAEYDSLPQGLEAKLDAVNLLCNNARGRLISRQVIANIIVDYLSK